MFEDVGLDVCKNVYMDLEYRKKWDGYVKGEVYLYFKFIYFLVFVNG